MSGRFCGLLKICKIELVKKINNMKKKSLLFLIFALLVFVPKINAQVNPIKQFTADPTKFLEEVRTMFQVSGMDKKDLNDFMEKFTAVWNSPKYDENLKQSTYSSCNLMVKKKMKILPEYKSYLNSIMNFVNSNQSELNFIMWQECINKILNAKSQRFFSEYLQMSENLFATNTFFKSTVISYSSDNNKYIFEFDSVPKVIFKSLNLKCVNNQGDSGVVYDTRGVYYPYKGIFVGKGGTVFWTRVDFPTEKVWAELKNYTVSLKTSGFDADSVLFYNKNYFEKPLLGKLEEKVVSERGSNISYPRFESYSKRMQIINIAKGVDYDGGFTRTIPRK